MGKRVNEPRSSASEGGLWVAIELCQNAPLPSLPGLATSLDTPPGISSWAKLIRPAERDGSFHRWVLRRARRGLTIVSHRARVWFVQGSASKKLSIARAEVETDQSGTCPPAHPFNRADRMSPARSATDIIVATGWAGTIVGINEASTTATFAVPRTISVAGSTPPEPSLSATVPPK
jgi:hypothetical protein